MAWTPPSKFIVVITFLLWGFGLFILLDQWTIFWASPYLPLINLIGSSYLSWLLIAMIVFFLSWFLFFLGVTLKGL
jgi:hypothetical protein